VAVLRTSLSRTPLCAAGALFLALVPAFSQPPSLLWSETQFYRYNIEQITLDKSVSPITVKVVFSVTNPLASNTPYDLKTSLPFRSPATLRVQIGWNTAEYTNTGALAAPPGFLLLPIYRKWMEPLLKLPPGQPATGGVGAAVPIQVDALKTAEACTPAACPGAPAGRFWLSSPLPPQAAGTGTVGMEGHPSRQTGVDAAGKAVYTSIPVKSAVRDFLISGATQKARRQIVDIAKCRKCHDDRKHGDVVVPRLSLHGANRNEAIGLCVICHNPNQTDIPYRASGAEESIDFKRMVHGIHAGYKRQTPLVIIGFRGSVNDYGHVRFPSDLSNCALCHLDDGSRGTHELRTPPVLGSTINTGSLITIAGQVDTDPANNLRISPIAATCSGCHDSKEVRQHMISNGASFGAKQADLQGKERCVTCHGPGKMKDVRRVHHEEAEDE
jgi:cytochrome c553